jgi:hypothetical protein
LSEILTEGEKIIGASDGMHLLEKVSTTMLAVKLTLISCYRNRRKVPARIEDGDLIIKVLFS